MDLSMGAENTHSKPSLAWSWKVVGVVFVVSHVMLWRKERESMLGWCPAAQLFGSLLDGIDGRGVDCFWKWKLHI